MNVFLIVLVLASLIGVLVRDRLRAQRFRDSLLEMAQVSGSHARDEASLLAWVNETRVHSTESNQQHLQDLSLLQILLADSPSGILVVDASQQVQHYNSRIASWFKRDAQMGGDRTLKEWFRDPRIESTFQQALSDRELRQLNLELTLPSKSETVHTFSVLFHPLQAGDDRVVVLFNDLTEDSSFPLWQSDLVANFSHEVRTPLTAIQGYTDLILDDLKNGRVQSAPEEFRQESESHLQVIRRNTERLLDLAQDLLELSSLDSQKKAGNQKLSIFREWVDAGRVTQGVLETLRPLQKQKNVWVNAQVPSDLLPLDADPFRLEQVLLNLIENAIKYSPPGQKVEVLWRSSPAREVVLEVVDRGQGISKDKLPWIFERFYRADHSRQRTTGGAGLGLAIVKLIAELHGGRVEVESTPERGSVFRVFWPAAVGESEQKP